MLLKTTNIKMGVRLGLLNQDHSKALIFEVDTAKLKGECLWDDGHGVWYDVMQLAASAAAGPAAKPAAAVACCSFP